MHYVGTLSLEQGGVMWMGWLFLISTTWPELTSWYDKWRGDDLMLI